MGKLVDLVPFDPENETHVAELRRQRVLCGWNVDAIEGWREKVRTGMKGLQWIFRADTAEAREHFKEPLPASEPMNFGGTFGPPPPDQTFTPIGHISLDWYDEVGEKELADKERGIISISTFFILVSQQGGGLGRIVMGELEQLAGRSPFNARVITLNTVDGELARSEEEWGDVRGGLDPTRKITEHWYQRMGYTAFRRRVPRYKEKTTDGGEKYLKAVYMRKDIGQSA